MLLQGLHAQEWLWPLFGQLTWRVHDLASRQAMIQQSAIIKIDRINKFDALQKANNNNKANFYFNATSFNLIMFLNKLISNAKI